MESGLSYGLIESSLRLVSRLIARGVFIGSVTRIGHLYCFYLSQCLSHFSAGNSCISDGIDGRQRTCSSQGAL